MYALAKGNKASLEAQLHTLLVCQGMFFFTTISQCFGRQTPVHLVSDKTVLVSAIHQHESVTGTYMRHPF